MGGPPFLTVLYPINALLIDSFRVRKQVAVQWYIFKEPFICRPSKMRDIQTSKSGQREEERERRGRREEGESRFIANSSSQEYKSVARNIQQRMNISLTAVKQEKNMIKTKLFRKALQSCNSFDSSAHLINSIWSLGKIGCLNPSHSSNLSMENWCKSEMLSHKPQNVMKR